MAEGAAVGFAVNVGAEALGALDKWLDGKRKAQSWFGDRYRTFTNIRWYKLNFSRISLFPHRIRQVFVINRDDWRLVLNECLNAAPSWDNESRRRETGECCWMHIYRTIGSERARRFLIKRNDSGSLISTVSSLPAARVESWGLFVLAYANGARLSQKQRTPDGSFRITLPCRDFIITILRYSATGPISAHLEPRPRSIDTYKPLRPDQWANLLEQGYSYNEFDPRFEWEIANVPSSCLLDNRLHNELKNTVLDFKKASDFKGKGRQLYFDCLRVWRLPVPAGNALTEEQKEFLSDLEEIKAVILDDNERSPKGFTAYDIPFVAERQLTFLRSQTGAMQIVLGTFEKLFAIVKILTFCEIVPKELTTRNTGTYISLA